MPHNFICQLYLKKKKSVGFKLVKKKKKKPTYVPNQTKTSLIFHMPPYL